MTAPPSVSLDVQVRRGAPLCHPYAATRRSSCPCPLQSFACGSSCDVVQEPVWARLYQHVFCKKPSLFLSSSRYRNFGRSESACRHCAYPNPVQLLLATPLVFMRRTGNVSISQLKATKFSTPAASPASHATDRFVLLRVHFYFRFLFLLIYAACFP